MKIKFRLFLLLGTMAFLGCEQSSSEKAGERILIPSARIDTTRITPQVRDSVKMIAEHFIWYNEHSSPPRYEIEEPDLDEWYLKNQALVPRYFPLILTYYDLIFGYKTLILCYLYIEGEKQYLEELLSHRELLTEGEQAILNNDLRNFGISAE